MEELLALQAELAAIQKAPSSTKLSEPNVVEVVQKLVDLGLLEVLFTTNGKEYLTPKQLKNEVEDEILAHGGRVNVTEIPPILNVDLPHIERVIDALVRDDPTMQLVQGEVITDYYLDGLAEEINQTLQSEGRLMLGDLAMQHRLSTDFVMRLLEPRLGSIVQAKLSNNTLYTTGHVARHAARVRGVMAAILRPCSHVSLIKAHGFDEALFYECIDELKASGRLPGTVQGKSSYTPAIHTVAQVASVRTFFELNGVIEYAALTRMLVRDPQAYLEANYPGGVPLGEVYMKRELLGAVEAELDEACASKWAVDVRSCFQCDLSDSDVTRLLSTSKSLSAALASVRTCLPSLWPHSCYHTPSLAYGNSPLPNPFVR